MGNKPSTANSFENNAKKEKTNEQTNSEKTFSEIQATRGIPFNDCQKQVEKHTSVNKKTRLAFDDWVNVRLTKFITDLEWDNFLLDISAEEYRDIKDAVEEIVDFLLTEVGNVDTRLKTNVRDVIRVGSFHDNMEVGEVTSVEYQVVIDDISDDNIVETIILREEGYDYVKVILTSECCKRYEDITLLENGKTRLKTVNGVVQLFHSKTVHSINILKEKNRCTIQRKTGKLELVHDGISQSGIQTRIKCVWKDEKVINILITPVIRTKAMTSIHAKMASSKTFFEQLHSVGFLVLKPMCTPLDVFQYSFEHVEAHVLKSIDQTHRTLYRFLKFIVVGASSQAIQEMNFFSDHVIGQLVIHHVTTCSADDRQGNCAISLLHDMADDVKTFKKKKTAFIPSCYKTNVNIVPSECRASVAENWNRTLEGLQHIANYLINEVCCMPLYEYKHSIGNFVCLNNYTLKKDYFDKKSDTVAKKMDNTERRQLVDAVGNRRFAVNFKTQ